MEVCRLASRPIALAVALIVFSPVCILILVGLAEAGFVSISEDMAGGIGVAALLEMCIRDRPRISPEALGALFYFFELACGISAHMSGVNPFDQPGVEAYKKNFFPFLEKLI